MIVSPAAIFMLRHLLLACSLRSCTMMHDSAPCQCVPRSKSVILEMKTRAWFLIADDVVDDSHIDDDCDNDGVKWSEWNGDIGLGIHGRIRVNCCAWGGAGFELGYWGTSVVRNLEQACMMTQDLQAPAALLMNCRSAWSDIS